MKIIPVISPIRQAVLVLIAALCLSAVPSTSWGGTPKRIISLAPNVTEILFALGLEENLIGVTDFCDYPAAAKKKRKIGGMSNPSLEAVVSLKPDLVILTTDGNPKEFKERLEAFNIRTYVVRSRRIQDLPQGIRDLGAALAVSAKADRLAADIELTLKKYRNKKPASPMKKVLFIVWPEPLIAAGPGTVIDDALRLLGAENIAGRASAAYPKYSIEDILRTSPDLIIVGKGMGNVEKVSEGLFRRLKILPAVRDRKVFYVSDDLYRLGPRTIHGIDEISGLLEK
ncbi:MAG: cobalamin-binding protein [Nitrospirae bacterium]|nr:MAG: cobalamin-binding protein [Nitrospirota bacterium]